MRKKRIISVLLVIVMIISILPITVMADASELTVCEECGEEI